MPEDFRHNKKAPTYEGRQRLETIAENTQLGAGFSIAMRDLEIRGTGDILGTRQHGHIALVGFHLYTRILAAAVRRLQKDRQLPAGDLETQLLSQVINVNVDLPQPVSIPADYVADKDVRLGLYRRMADIGTLAEVDALGEEFNDRFGSLPEAVHHLLYQLKIKLLAERAGLSSVTAEAGQLVLRFPEGEPPADLPDLGSSVRVGKVALWIPLAPLEDWPAELSSILEILAAYRQEGAHEALPAGYADI
jgi:transcription-repair coupling factor (superfamily II helicase)